MSDNDFSALGGVVGTSWIRVLDDLLAGKGMYPYNKEEMGNFVDWTERDDAQAFHAVPHHGQLLIDVISTEANAVHLPIFPNDEFILIVTCGLTLTSDENKMEQTFTAGDRVIVPKGWAGTWRVHADPSGKFREMAIVPGNYFDTSLEMKMLPDVAPALVEAPTTPGIHNIYQGTFIVEAQNAAEAGEKEVDQSADEVIQVLAGVLTLKGEAAEERFEAGSTVIVPKGFQGYKGVSADYRALNARASD